MGYLTKMSRMFKKDKNNYEKEQNNINNTLKEEPVKEEPVKEEPVKEEPVKENLKTDDSYLNPRYNYWMACFDTCRTSDIEEMKTMANNFEYKPLISLILPVYNTEISVLRSMLDSVVAQPYANWELCICDDGSTNSDVKPILEEYANNDSRIHVIFSEKNGGICVASNNALSIASGEYSALVDHDDYLPLRSLFTVCFYINKHSNKVDLLYSDEDKLDQYGRRFDPYFKCDWDRRLFYSQNYIAHLGVYRTSILKKIGGFREGFEGSQDYDLALRFIKEIPDDRIVHIPYILYHWRKYPGNGSFSTNNQRKSDDSAKKALLEYFDGTVDIKETGSVGCWSLTTKKQHSSPLISIIIPTKDKLFLLKNCVNGLLNKTNYSNIEIIIVDNNSIERSTKKYLININKNSKVTVLRYPGEFNYSRINNVAVNECHGEYILFLNNDISIIEPNWLNNMVNVIQQENVGAVGAKLLYASDTLQHGGVTLGIYEVASHSMRHTADGNNGYFGLIGLERSVSAVTAACMLIKKDIFFEVGKFNEKDLAVSFNDVDLCLRVTAEGYKVVYTPASKLYHLESQSRGLDITKKQKEQNYAERRYMIMHYGEKLRNDPYYNPNLSLLNENYDFLDNPRVGKPWRDWIEFVCPFHRGDVLIGLEVAYTVSKKYNKKIRVHVSKDIFSWLDAFPKTEMIEILPVDVPIPTSIETPQFYEKAMNLVRLREDSSCKIVTSRPTRDIELMGVNLVENMLREFGIPISEKLINFVPIDCNKEKINELSNIISNNPLKTVLLHPYGGWLMKSMPKTIIDEIVDICHEYEFNVIQIGGDKDAIINGVDGTCLANLSLSEWKYLFENCHGLIGVDSWTCHFASLLDIPQMVMMGSTAFRDVGSKYNYINQKNPCYVCESTCDLVPCNSIHCKYGGKYCIGMELDRQILTDFLKKQPRNN